MTTDLPCVDAKFKSEWVAVAPRWITTQCRHFKDECVVYRSTGLPGPPIYFFGAILIASIRWQ